MAPRYNHFYNKKPKAPNKNLNLVDLIENSNALTRVVASILLVTGAIAISAVAPNLIWAVGKVSKSYKSKKAYQKKASQVVYYLKRHGYVQIGGEGINARIMLTSKGRALAESSTVLNISRPNKWDGGFWVVASDIPTRDHRKSADKFRRGLLRLGFYSIQKSLWIYPYNPTNAVNSLTSSLQIGRFVTLMKVVALDKDDEQLLRKHFQLN